MDIKALREAKGLTQAELADLCGLTPSAISHFEGGRRKPNHNNTMRLMQVLGINQADPMLKRIVVERYSTAVLCEARNLLVDHFQGKKIAVSVALFEHLTADLKSEFDYVNLLVLEVRKDKETGIKMYGLEPVAGEVKFVHIVRRS